MGLPTPPALALVLAVSGLGCGDDAPAPRTPPASLTSGPITVETDPLRLVIDAPGGALAVEDFVEVGTVATVDPTRYYDPRDPGDEGVTWTAATRAVDWDEAAGLLTLDSGATLTLTDGSEPGVATLRFAADAVAGAVLVRLVLPHVPGEPVHGFGESLVSTDASGTVREAQFRLDLDSESSLNEVHVPVPLALWPARGLGAFLEEHRPGAFDVGASRAGAVLATFTLPARGAVAAQLFVDDTPLALLRRYARLTALPAVPPLWAFAPQQWRNVHDSSDEVRADAHAMRDLDVPGSVMWIDNPWQTAYNTFTFDETRFAGPAALIEELTALGYRVLVWSTPYVNLGGLTADDHAEGVAAGYFVTDDVGLAVTFPWQDGVAGMVDFTAPGAAAWWGERIRRATALGVDGFKLDFGEEIVPELGGNLLAVELHDGDAQVMHGRYQQGYHAAYLDELPDGDGFLITRAGAWGEQAVNTCVWPGDLDSDFSRHGVDNGDGQRNVGGLPAAIAAGLSLSVSGYPFFGSDIGGFRGGVPTTEVLLRWAEYAALGTIMQLGGGGDSHNPWDTTLFDDGALDVYRRYARLHMDLVPYLYTLAVAAGIDGTPVTRPTRFVHPEAASDDATFLVGDVLFVAPVIEAGATTRAVILPPGTWIDWWTGALVVGDGATEITVDAPLDRLPLWRRAGALLPLFARAADTLEPATAPGVRSYADPQYGRELRLLVTPLSSADRIELFDGSHAELFPIADAITAEVSAGDRFDVFTLDVDARAGGIVLGPTPPAVLVNGAPLAEAADADALEGCAAPGCWWQDLTADRLQIRVWATDGPALIDVGIAPPG
jgi:alpha-D-xyloside xylohydrolase